MHDRKISFAYSWTAIVLAFIFFFPLGIYLLIKRISIGSQPVNTVVIHERYSDGVPVQPVKDGKIMKIWAIVCCVLTVIYLIMLFIEPERGPYLTAAVFFGVIGAVLMVISVKLQKKSDKIKKYSAVISSGISSLESIAEAMGNSYGETYRDLEDMIRSNILRGAYIDEKRKKLVTSNQSGERIEEGGKTVTVKCPFCGAACEIRGTKGECGYCGSVVKV